MNTMHTKIILIVGAILLQSHVSFGDDVTGILEEIAKRKQIIEEELDTCEVYEKEYYAPGGFGYLKTYFKKGEIRKIRDEFHGDGGSAMRECYYWDEKMFLVCRTIETFQLWPEQLISELEKKVEEFYYDEGQLVKWTIRTTKEMDPREEDFQDAEEIVGTQIHNLLRFSKSEYEDLDSFYEFELPLIDWALLEGEGDVYSLPDEALNYLQKLEAHIESHDWESVLDMADRKHYRMQVVEFGIGHDQYIKELIGIHMGNDLAPDKDSKSEYPSCDRITDVTFDTWSKQGRSLVIQGTITDNESNELQLRIMLLSTYHGIYLTGAFG